MDNYSKKVQSWWEKNPFVYNKALGVGRVVETNEMDIGFFDNVERRYKKHSGGSTGDWSKPVFSRFISYKDLKGKKVLDIASGTGFATVAFAKNGCDVTAIDITDYAVDATNKNLQLRNLQGKAIKMDAQKLSFADNTFDFVCAHGCLMHMPDTDKAVQEIYRVLKPGGQCYAWMYHKGWFYWFNIIFLRGILLGRLLKYKFDTLKMTSRYTDGAHIGGNPKARLYSFHELHALFKNASFKKVLVNVNYNPNEWESWPLKSFRLGNWLIPVNFQRFFSEKLRFGFGVSIVATKPKN